MARDDGQPVRRTAVGFTLQQPVGQPRDGAGGEEVPDERVVDRQPVSYSGDHSGRQHRIATASEEIVMYAHRFDAKYTGNQIDKSRIEVVPRPRISTPNSHLLQERSHRTSIHLAVRRQWHLLKKLDPGGNHVAGQ
ncbi:Uncharacterised protein [Mycobacteroides abscessus subsp. abscessus]|nr:Uncharacterised protein [Mycobacteroides abscessus subsp. abscessus]